MRARTPTAPPPAVEVRAAGVLGWRPRRWRRVDGGYTPAARFVGAAGGRRCFLKVATTAMTADMLRREARAYEVVRGAFMPRFIGWDDHPSAPLLLIEDLGRAVWPPPWTTAAIEAVLAQIGAMHAASADLPSMVAVNDRVFGGWSTVAEQPEPFLALGVVSASWLAAALPRLVAAEAHCRTDGTALTHFDLRSDNMCLTADGAKFIDWSAACLGNPELDLGGWLPSLELEGGPPPEAILPKSPEVAAWISGYFAARAGLPTIADAPRVRAAQKAQLSTALPWARRALGLGELS